MIAFSFFHSFTMLDYNLPCYLGFVFLWNTKEKEQFLVTLNLLISIFIDFLYILFYSKSFDLK